MVVKDVALPEFDRLSEYGYADGAPIPDGFDENDDPYLSLPAYVERLDEAWDDINRLGLQRQAVELQTLGYTHITPELVGPPEFQEEVLRATLEVAKRRRGIEYSIKGGIPELNLYGKGADLDANERYILLESDKYILFEDPVFEQVLMNERVLALVTLQLGQGALLSQMYSLFRHSNTPPLPLHCDSDMSPFRPYQTLTAVTWCLTDFNGIGDGATCYVPGTHVFRRRPTKYEGYVHMAHTRSIYAPAGSVLVHSGSMWHGAPTRQSEGIRVSMNMFYVKGNMRQNERYVGREPEGILDRNPPRFAHLLGHLVAPDGEILTRGEEDIEFAVNRASGYGAAELDHKRRAAYTKRRVL